LRRKVGYETCQVWDGCPFRRACVEQPGSPPLGWTGSRAERKNPSPHVCWGRAVGAGEPFIRHPLSAKAFVCVSRGEDGLSNQKALLSTASGFRSADIPTDKRMMCAFPQTETLPALFIVAPALPVTWPRTAALPGPGSRCRRRCSSRGWCYALQFRLEPQVLPPRPPRLWPGQAAWVQR
jgi:hypothetical protein